METPTEFIQRLIRDDFDKYGDAEIAFQKRHQKFVIKVAKTIKVGGLDKDFIEQLEKDIEL